MQEEIRMILWRGLIAGQKGKLTAHPMRLRDGILRFRLFWQPYEGNELTQAYAWSFRDVATSIVGLNARWKIALDEFIVNCKQHILQEA